MKKTIFLVEDHNKTRELIKSVLKRDGFSILCAPDLADGRKLLKKGKPDLMILDIRLPDGDGLELCALARCRPDLAKTPIIALTGLTEFKDKKRGFEAGVDQYLEKPIDIDELSLWVKALFRRVELNGSGGLQLSFGDLQISPDSFVIRFREQVIGNLTSREFDLFYYLVRTSPKVSSRQTIISEVWKTASVINLVDTHIFNLRQKLPPPLAARVQSISGKGFRYFQ